MFINCPDKRVAYTRWRASFYTASGRVKVGIQLLPTLLSGPIVVAMVRPVTALLQSRYTAASTPEVAEGWTLKRCTPPSRLFGANGLRTGPDGRVYIAQVTGSQISALDIDTGEVEAISPKGGGIVGPDDVAFTDHGHLVATEVMNGRVSILDNGGSRVLRDDVPSANGITVHKSVAFAFRRWRRWSRCSARSA